MPGVVFAARIVAAMTAAAFGYAIVGAIGRTPRFAPIDTDVSVWAILLLSFTFLPFAVVGALVVSRDPRNAVGWLFLSIGTTVAVTLSSLVYVQTGMPGRTWANWSSEWSSLGPFAQLPLVLLLFPDGRLPSRRWRPVAWLCLVNGIILVGSAAFSPFTYAGHPFDNPLGIEALPEFVTGGGVGWWLLPFAMVGGAASFISRFRASAGAQRLQLKWFAFAASLVAIGYLIQQVSWMVRSLSDTNLPALALIVLVFCVTTLPTASGIAILRYHLYDIDIIINRTVVYGALTAVLALLYGAGVVTIGNLVQQLAGRKSDDLAVAGSTLAVAAAFGPARGRIQHLINRHFYRQKYDAGKAVAALSARLRDDLDPQRASDHLISLVHETLQPSRVSLWLKP